MEQQEKIKNNYDGLITTIRRIYSDNKEINLKAFIEDDFLYVPMFQHFSNHRDFVYLKYYTREEVKRILKWRRGAMSRLLDTINLRSPHRKKENRKQVFVVNPI